MLTAERLVEKEEFLTASVVAERLGKSGEYVRLLATRADRPLPCIETPRGVRVFIWSEVRKYMRDREP